MKKIFLLDDNAEFVEITEIVLQKDYIIKSSMTVEKISEQIRDFAPDLILIDHFIGDHNSETIVKEITEAIPGFKVPFILFSASPDIEEKASKLGASGYIEKPSSIHDMKAYIKNHFDSTAN